MAHFRLSVFRADGGQALRLEGRSLDEAMRLLEIYLCSHELRSVPDGIEFVGVDRWRLSDGGRAELRTFPGVA